LCDAERQHRHSPLVPRSHTPLPVSRLMVDTSSRSGRARVALVGSLVLLGITLSLVVSPLVAASNSWSSSSASDKVLLSSVTALTLHRGEYTKGRRSTPIPQLRCTAHCTAELDAVQCRNVGSDGAGTTYGAASKPSQAWQHLWLSHCAALRHYACRCSVGVLGRHASRLLVRPHLGVVRGLRLP